RLDRRILQFVERGALRRRGLERLGDAIGTQVGRAPLALAPKPGEIALVLGGGVGIPRRCDGVEARLLLVAERLVEALERRAHGLHGRKHDLQPALHGRNPSGRDAGQVLRATGLEHVDGLGACGAQFFERRTLRVGWLYDLGNALDRPVGQLRSVVAANFGGAAFATVHARRTAGGRSHAVPTRTRGGRDIGVVTVDAVVDVVIGVGPEVVIGIRPVHVVEEVVIGVGPEQRSVPAQYEPAPPPGPPRGPEEWAGESGRRELRSQSYVGDGAVAEHAAAAPVGAAYPRERAGRGGGKAAAGAREPRRRDARRRQ